MRSAEIEEFLVTPAFEEFGLPADKAKTWSEVIKRRQFCFSVDSHGRLSVTIENERGSRPVLGPYNGHDTAAMAKWRNERWLGLEMREAENIMTNNRVLEHIAARMAALWA